MLIMEQSRTEAIQMLKYISKEKVLYMRKSMAYFKRPIIVHDRQ